MSTAEPSDPPAASSSSQPSITWPIDPVTSKSSTTSTAKKVWISALEPLLSSSSSSPSSSSNTTTDNNQGGNNDANNATASKSSDDPSLQQELQTRAQSLKSAIENSTSQSWRSDYVSLLTEHAELMALAPPTTALTMAREGLKSLSTLLLYGTDTDAPSVHDAVFNPSKPPPPFETHTVTAPSSSSTSSPKITIPAPRKHPSDPPPEPLCDTSLHNQLRAWADYGCIEESVVHAITAVSSPDVSLSSLLRDWIFVLVGGTSALGPFKDLIQWGGTVAVIARPGKKLEALQSFVTGVSPNDTLPGGGTLLLPSRDDVPGADLLTESPALARWVTGLCPDKKMVICQLVYADGEKNVRVNVGADVMAEYVRMNREGEVALSYLASPSTAHLMPTTALKSHPINKKKTSTFYTLPFTPLLTPQSLTPLPNNPSYTLYPGLLPLQGPNYALTKTFQLWRAMVARFGDNTLVSANFGPPSRTSSMVSHSRVAAALEGMQYFVPHVTFDESVARGVMTALLLWDLNFEESVGNPKTTSATTEGAHPMEMFVENACHGGGWRCPYTTESLGVASFALGKVTTAGLSPEGSVAE